MKIIVTFPRPLIVALSLFVLSSCALFAQPTTVWVDDNFANPVIGQDPDGAGPATNFGTDSFATIQAAINAVAPNGTIYVLAGSYYEDVVVNKPVTILGPNASIDPNTGSRVAEAVVYPATSNPDPNNDEIVIYVTANNVTIKGLTVNGDNPSLTSGIVSRGADIDAAEGIVSFEGVGSITLQNNIIKNTSYTGVDFYNFSNNGGATSGNYIQANRFINIGTTNYGYGISVLIYNNFYAEVSSNVTVDVRVGLQTGNFSNADPGSTRSIHDNTFTTTRRGIFYNLHYSAASPFTISNNTITAEADLTISNWDGMLISSQQGSVTSVIRSNNIDGSAAIGTSTGYQVWNCPATAGAVISGGTVIGCSYGAWVNNYDGYSSPGDSSVMTLQGVSVTGATTAGIYVKDNPANPNPATVSAVVQNGCSISSSGVGILVDGIKTSVSPADTAMTSITGNYVTLTNGETNNVDATSVSLNGSVGSAMNNAQLFAVEDKILHKVDNAALGFVRVKAANVYVTSNSGSVQRGVNVANAGDTVNVNTGTFVEQVTIASDITLAGSGAATIVQSPASLPNGFTTSAANHPVIYVHDTAAATVRDLTIDGNGQANANYRMIGAGYYNAGGLMQNLVVKGVRETPISGTQQGNAIYCYTDATPIRNIEVAGCTCFDFQKNGITINGTYSVGNVHDNQVTGAGAVNFIAQNGIQFGFGATGSIVDNEVSGFNYTPNTDEACAVLIYQSSASILSNKLNASELGIGVDTPLPGMAITYNSFSSDIYGVYNYNNTTLTATSNWWGSATGPGDATLNPYGSGSGVTTFVTFSPWLGDGTDTSAALGFQPNLSPVYYKPVSVAFVTQPTTSVINSSISPAPSVEVRDETSSRALQFSGPITIAIGSNPSSGVLSGTNPQNASSGLATFPGLSIDKVGAGYTLVASAPNLTSATSSAFDEVNPVPAITSLSPTFAVVGGSGFTLTVTGTGFIPTSTVNWNGSARTTTYVSATQLTASILASDIAATGADNVTVFNPTPGGGTSAPATFNVYAVPTIVYVDASFTSTSSGGHIWGYDAFTTVQAGINAVGSGGTVKVAAGSYSGATINKSLSLLGANSAISGCAGRGAESVINGGAGTALTVASDDVTVSGFEVNGVTGISARGHLGVVISNNKATSCTVGIDAGTVTTTASKTITIQNNCVGLTAQITSQPTVGILLTSVSGSQCALVQGNTVSGAFYGYLLFDLNAATAGTVQGGAISGTMQGVAVVNSFPPTAPVLKGSTFRIDGVTMSGFAGDYTSVPALAALNFQAGVYVYSTGNDTTTKLIGVITNLTIDGTGRITGDSSALNFADFSTVAGTRQQVSVTNCTLINNLNRGVSVSGSNAVAVINRCTITNNGANPYGTNGNPGFGVVARNNSQVTVTESFIINPATQVSSFGVYAVSANANTTPQGPTLVVSGCYLSNNGNANGQLAWQTAGVLNLSGNYLGSTVPATIAGLITGVVDYTPYLDSGTDTSGTAGFQGDFSKLHATASSPQTGGAGRIQEAIDLATGSTIIVEAGTYTENILANHDNLELAGVGQSQVTIVPAISAPDTCAGSLCPGASSIILVQANGVKIHDMTLDGNNPSISSGVTTGGVDTDARNGIITDHTLGPIFNNLEVYNVTVMNIFLRGIYASTGGSFNFHDNTVQNVQGNGSSIGMFNYSGSGVFSNNVVSLCGDAISANWSTGTVFKNNTITSSGSGIHTDNSSGPDVIQGNNISAMTSDSYGAWVFAPYGSVQIIGNTISGCNVSLASAGQNAPTTPLIQNNVVSAGSGSESIGALQTTSLFGFGTADSTTVFQGNNISGTDYGFYLDTESTNVLSATINSNTITNNQYGVYGTGPGKVKIQSDDLRNNSVAAIYASSGTTIDAGNCGADVTGLGDSTGGNNLSGYLTGSAKAVLNANAGTPAVLAYKDDFGATPGSPAIATAFTGNVLASQTPFYATDLPAASIECLSSLPAAATTLAQYQTQGGAVSATAATVGSSDSTLVYDGVITRTYTITDACGQSATTHQTINVHDAHAPSITTCPAARTLNVGSQCNVAVPNVLPEVAVSDNCDPSLVTVTQSPVAGTLISIGTTQVTITATDKGNNSATCQFNITVQDTNAAPANVYVDTAYTGMPNGTVVKFPNGGGGADHYIGCDAFATIQGGINRVATGGTVQVAGGSYAESVALNKAITLQGAGYAQSTIIGPIGGDSATVRLSATGAILDGFTVTRQGNNTTDWNNPSLKSAGAAVQGVGGTTIRNCWFEGNRTGIDINLSDSNVIVNNVITNNRSGIILRNSCRTNAIANNAVVNNWTVGVLWLDTGISQLTQGTTVVSNNVSGNWYAGIQDRRVAVGTFDVWNCSGNWLGTAAPVVSAVNTSEPGYAAQIPVQYGGTAVPPGGAPALAGAGVTNIDYTPWLDSGTDTSVAFGFQGDFSKLHAAAASAQTGNTGRIQEAINMASGSTIIIEPGNYTENILANHDNLELAGVGQSQVTIVPAISAPNTCGGSLCPSASSIILVQANGVKIHDMTLDGNNPSISSGVTSAGVDLDARNGIITDHTLGPVFNNLEVSNVTVKNIYLRGIYASTGGSFNFHDNTVQNVQADPSSIGMFNFGGSGVFSNNTVSLCGDAISANWSTGTTFKNNTITSSGSGIHTDNSSGPDVIQGNNISAMTSDSYGAWVFAPYGSVQIIGNTISGCNVGLASAGQGAAVTPLFQNNVVSAGAGTGSAGVYETTSLFGFGSANNTTLFQGNNISGTVYGFYLEDEPSYALSATINSNNSITNNQYGVYATGAGKVKIESDDLRNNSVAAIYGDTGATIDAGNCGADVTGLGDSTGGNNLSGYLTGSAKAIQNANVSTPAVLAYQDNFGATAGSPAIAGAFTGNVQASQTPFYATDLSTVAIVCLSDLPAGATSLSAYQAQGGAVSATAATVSFSDSPHVINGAITRTYTITDACGQIATTHQTINVHDGVAPVLLGIPANVTVECNAIPPVGSPTATDNCDPSPSITYAASSTQVGSGLGHCNYTITRTWTATDATGNSSSSSQQITVINSSVPVLLGIPADVTVQCDAVPNVASPTATDNCDPSPSIALTQTTAPGSCTGSSVITRTWTVTDSCGNSGSASQHITLIDTTAPVLVGVPTDATVDCNAVPGPANVTATDNCDTNSVVSIDSVSSQTPTGPGHDTYILTRTWTATDSCGNSITAQQTLTVAPIAPVITAFPADITYSCSSEVPAPDDNLISATDPCGGDVIYIYHDGDVITDMNCANQYNIARAYHVTNVCGVIASRTQHITVNDTTPPMISAFPADATLVCMCDLPAPDDGLISASDNCSSVTIAHNADVTNNIVDAMHFDIQRAYVASDVCGNQSIHTQTFHMNLAPSPSIAISNAPSIRVSNSVYTVHGTAASTFPLVGVHYSLNAGADQLATGTTNWSAVLHLVAGTNTLTAYVVDNHSIVSTTAVATIFYYVPSKLTIQIYDWPEGSDKFAGSITPNLNGQLLEIGKDYTITASAISPHRFVGWAYSSSISIPVFETNTTLTFTMTANLKLVARFEDPYYHLTGTWSGLFSEASPDSRSAGFISFSLSRTSPRRPSGFVLLDGTQYTIPIAQFDTNGHAHVVVPRSNKSSLTVDMDIDVVAYSSNVTGTITTPEWNANMLLHRGWTTPGNAEFRNYTMAFPAASGTTPSPSGWGVGSTKNNTSGTVNFVGFTADGAQISVPTTYVSADLEWPMYGQMYGSKAAGYKGSIWGWLTFSKDQPGVTGTLYWWHPAGVTNGGYTAGFSNVIQVVGSPYTNNPTGTSDLGWIGPATISIGDDSGLAITADASTDNNNKITVSTPNTNRISLTVSSTTGLITGKFGPPSFKTLPAVRGAILPNNSIVLGNFFTKTNGGAVILQRH